MTQKSEVEFSTVRSAALANAVSRKTIGEGSLVFVRVLKNNGKNIYTVLCAGERFSLRSEIPLKEGATFHAKIRLDGKKILLVQQKANMLKGTPLEKSFPAFDQNGKALSAALSSYLQNLQVPPDETSYALLNQMKLLGMKFNAVLVKKMRLAAKNAGGDKNTAAETALLLEKKGIQANKKTIEAILEHNEHSNGEGKSDRKNRADEILAISDTEESLEKNIQAAFETYIGVLTGNKMPGDSAHNTDKPQKEGEADNTPHKNTGNTNGILSLFNHTGFDLQSPLFSGSWIKIPFEMERLTSKGQDEFKISGFLSLFVQPLKKSVEKCVIRLNCAEKEYIFSLTFEGGKCVKIRSNIEADTIGGIPIEKRDAQHITDFDAGEGGILLKEIKA